MKPFRFRLESLLRVREADRDARRAELAQSLAVQERLRVELELGTQQLAESRRNDRELRQSTAFSLESLRQSDSLRQVLAVKQTRILAAVAESTSDVDACQLHLAAAEREYQAVARLKASRLAEYQRDAVRQESKLADEAAGRAFRRAA